VSARAAATAIHGLVERCRTADYPPMICRLSSGWVVMGERQVFPGYCLLLPDPVVPHLNALDPPRRDEFLSQMALVGAAVMAAVQAVRINYAMFGNLEPALHAHIIPRFADEPAATRTAQPWSLDWTEAPRYTDAAHGGLKRRIAAAIAGERAVD
jgi:diadenosine tetraphosphate (Ap4A) HIT family hydrolase